MDGKVVSRKKGLLGGGGTEPMEISLAIAAKLAKKLGLAPPSMDVVNLSIAADPKRNQRGFRYSGPVNDAGQPHGMRGTVRWDDGEVYVGGLKDGLRHGHGMVRLNNGDVYKGQNAEGMRHGIGTYKFALSGNAEVGRFRMGNPVGEGARWSRNRDAACVLLSGQKGKQISLQDAETIASRLGLAVPPVHLQLGPIREDASDNENEEEENEEEEGGDDDNVSEADENYEEEDEEEGEEEEEEESTGAPPSIHTDLGSIAEESGKEEVEDDEELQM